MIWFRVSGDLHQGLQAGSQSMLLLLICFHCAQSLRPWLVPDTALMELLSLAGERWRCCWDWLDERGRPPDGQQHGHQTGGHQRSVQSEGLARRLDLQDHRGVLWTGPFLENTVCFFAPKTTTTTSVSLSTFAAKNQGNKWIQKLNCKCDKIRSQWFCVCLLWTEIYWGVSGDTVLNVFRCRVMRRRRWGCLSRRTWTGATRSSPSCRNPSSITSWRHCATPYPTPGCFLEPGSTTISRVSGCKFPGVKRFQPTEKDNYVSEPGRPCLNHFWTLLVYPCLNLPPQSSLQTLTLRPKFRENKNPVCTQDSVQRCTSPCWEDDEFMLCSFCRIRLWQRRQFCLQRHGGRSFRHRDVGCVVLVLSRDPSRFPFEAFVFAFPLEGMPVFTFQPNEALKLLGRFSFHRLERSRHSLFPHKIPL